MKTVSMLLFAVMALLSLSSCDLDKDDANFYFSALPITAAEIPETFDLNRTYEIKVTFNVPDKCTDFVGFDVSKQDLTTRNVVVVGRVLTDPDPCTLANQEITTSFFFEVLYDEPYLFRFWQGESENGEAQFLEVTVPVN